MTIIFDEVVGEITPEPAPNPTPQGPQASGSDDQDVRPVIRALARERWKQDRLRSR